MDNRTGKIYEDCEKIDAEELLRSKLGLNKVLMTHLTEKEYETMKQIPEEERPSDLAWSRYQEGKDLSDLTLIEAFCDGFKKAKKIYDKFEQEVLKDEE